VSEQAVRLAVQSNAAVRAAVIFLALAILLSISFPKKSSY